MNLQDNTAAWEFAQHVSPEGLAVFHGVPPGSYSLGVPTLAGHLSKQVQVVEGDNEFVLNTADFPAAP